MEDRKILKKNQNYIEIAGIIILAAIARLVPHPPNVAPITGLALFSGAKIKNKTAYFVPLLTMFVSDFVLGFHSTMLYVYISFFIIVLIGKVIKNKKNSLLLPASLVSSLLFYLITNFGVWFSTTLYPKSLFGLVNCYIMGLPFLRNTVVGDLFYSFVFFYGYSYFLVLIKKLAYNFKDEKS